MLSLALLGALSLHGRATRTMVSTAFAFSASMVIVTGMLLAASEQLRRSQLSNPLHMPLRGLEPSMPHAAHASVGEAQGCQGASPDCALCAMGGGSGLRLACEHRACCDGETACNASLSSRRKDFIHISVHNEQRTFDSRISQ
ncbi:hypothetical protein [Paraburkholderia diazotrophica]|uniref:hypothetical protein n=1 Tax=Paraburkholderia diazotrophica TaxID=667676 RepID=UPI001C433762|nr:hypothetical protein [Paraburkholderia diazotrophica]